MNTSTPGADALTAVLRELRSWHGAKVDITILKRGLEVRVRLGERSNVFAGEARELAGELEAWLGRHATRPRPQSG